MNAYQRYMEPIRLTPEERDALRSALEARSAARRKPSHLPRLAACACGLALLAGLGVGLSQAPEESAAAPDPVQGAVSGAPVLTLDPKATPDARLYAGPDTLETPAEAVPLPWSTPVPSEPVTVIEAHPEDGSGSTDASLVPADPEGGSIFMVDGGAAPSAAADLTLEACRALPRLGAHVPETLPEGFSFASGTSGPDQEGGSWLTLLWSDGALGEVFLSLTQPETPPEPMDVSDPAAYDVRLYERPWSERLPEAVRAGGFADPVFRWEDLTEEVVAARGLPGDGGDAGGLRFTFRVLYPDGVVAAYRIKGLTRSEAAALVLG